MKRVNPALVSAIRDWPSEIPSEQTAARAISINLTHDERIAPGRETVLAELMPDVGWAGLREGFALYRDQVLTWSGDTDPGDRRVPEPFTAANDGAALAGLPEDWTELVRVVQVEWALDALPTGPTGRAAAFDRLRMALAVHRGRAPAGATMAAAEATAFLADVVDAFNRTSRGQPSFAGFLREVRAVADGPGWAAGLRDRFGVGHWDAGPAAPLMLMQLRYPLSRVRDRLPPEVRPELAFRVPTTLEARYYQFYFPSPTPQPFGRTVDLNGPLDGRPLTCEIIHFPVPLGMDDIWDVEMLADRIPGAEDYPQRLRDIRNAHLSVLRDECQRTDFAEEM